MTDYKKYINALRKCAKEHENDRLFTGHVIVSDLCREVADLLEILEQEPKWFPVTEDVPQKGTVCLWCNKQGNVFVSEITTCLERTSYVGKHGYFSNGLENYGNIVAWMPLPKAYKAESDG